MHQNIFAVAARLTVLILFLHTLSLRAETLGEWRATNFGTTADAGSAANLADPDKDQLSNLVEYSLLLEPNKPTHHWGSVTVEGSEICLTYSRRKAALGEVSFQCLWADGLAGPWSSAGMTESTLSDNGTLQSIKVKVPLGGVVRRFFKIQLTYVAPALPAAPGNALATATSTTEVDLTWSDNATNESGYKIERRVSGGNFDAPILVGANTTTFHNTGLTPGTTYVYRIAATNDTGDSAFSADARVTLPVLLPAVPTNPQATAVSTSQITVTWTDNATSETGFVIERRQSGTPDYILLAEPGANVTLYQDTGLPTGIKFYYRIAAKNATGTSAFSSTVDARTLSVPAAPSNLVATAVSTSQIDLVWTDNSTNETGFKVERRKSGTPDFILIGTVGADVTTYQSTGLPSETRFHYRISATNAVGDSDYSVSASADVLMTPIPRPPSGLLANAISTSQINISWADNSGNETKFRIERRQSGSPTFALLAEVAAGGGSYFDSGLNVATRYYYQVCAVNANGSSAFSAEASAETLALPVGLDGPGIGNLNYAANEYMQVISRIDTNNGVPPHAGHGYGLNVASMHKGYLSMVFAPDSGGGPGGLLFYDVSNPRNPVLVNRVYEPTGRTAELREAHSMGFCSNLGGDLVVLQSGRGIEFWDWTDVRNPQQISKLAMPNVGFGDYNNVAWQLVWQAPYVYVAAAEQGVYIVDASDPRNPRLVDRGGGQPNPVPCSQLGGFRVGPIFVVGNLMVLTGMGSADGYSTLNISNPANPQLLGTIGNGVVNYYYSTTFNGNRIYSSAEGPGAIMMAHDVSNPSNIALINNSQITIERMLYCTTQDQYLIQGCQEKIVKVDTTNWNVVGEGSLNVPTSDHGQVTMVGNLVFVGNDHGTGSGLICHQTTADTRGPEVNMISPANNSVNQARTSRVGITLTDNVDLRTVSTASFIIRPVGGSAIPGKYSAQNAIVNFWPDQPLAAHTTYEVVIPTGGMRDWMGNAVTTPFHSTFTTGP